MEVSKESVSFKRFESKEQAQAFKEEEFQNGRIWSDIKDHPKGGVYVGYALAGQLAVEAVTESGRDYGMVIDLTAGYMLGKTWAMCH